MADRVLGTGADRAKDLDDNEGLVVPPAVVEEQQVPATPDAPTTPPPTAPPVAPEVVPGTGDHLEEK